MINGIPYSRIDLISGGAGLPASGCGGVQYPLSILVHVRAVLYETLGIDGFDAQFVFVPFGHCREHVAARASVIADLEGDDLAESLSATTPLRSSFPPVIRRYASVFPEASRGSRRIKAASRGRSVSCAPLAKLENASGTRQRTVVRTPVPGFLKAILLRWRQVEEVSCVCGRVSSCRLSPSSRSRTARSCARSACVLATTVWQRTTVRAEPRWIALTVVWRLRAFVRSFGAGGLFPAPLTEPRRPREAPCPASITRVARDIFPSTTAVNSWVNSLFRRAVRRAWAIAGFFAQQQHPRFVPVQAVRRVKRLALPPQLCEGTRTTPATFVLPAWRSLSRTAWLPPKRRRPRRGSEPVL